VLFVVVDSPFEQVPMFVPLVDVELLSLVELVLVELLSVVEFVVELVLPTVVVVVHCVPEFVVEFVLCCGELVQPATRARARRLAKTMGFDRIPGRRSSPGGLTVAIHGAKRLCRTAP